jgi:hypothetical protein
VKVIAEWWTKNRPSAPTLFDEELRLAIERLKESSTIGLVYETVNGEIVRRMLLPRTAQHLYYAVDSSTGVVLVHAVWGARRGRGPKL